MDLVKTYGNIIQKNIDAHPVAARRMINVGLGLEKFRTTKLADKRTPYASRELNTLAVEKIRRGLMHPEKAAWTNLFTPVEILQCFDLNCLSVEAISSFLSGFTIEDAFIHHAEGKGLAASLCSYHKCFLGAYFSGILPVPKLAVTTSIACDANFNTFRLAGKKANIPVICLDVPFDSSLEGEEYLIRQLNDLIRSLEEITGIKFDIDLLRVILRQENESKRHYIQALTKKAKKLWPTTLTLQMYELFATHLSIGTKETLSFFRNFDKEIDTMPDFNGKRLFWVHLIPFYHPVIKDALNYSDAFQIQAMEMNLDNTKPLDPKDPIRSLAKKLIGNLYNRPFEEKEKLVLKAARKTGADGIIHFCHWGCKQSIGGVMRLKEAMRKAGIPFLILDGDAIDRMNDTPGQIKTRLEAFLELLDKE